MIFYVLDIEVKVIAITVSMSFWFTFFQQKIILAQCSVIPL